MKLKTIFKTFFIDIIFLFILFGISNFVWNKIQTYILFMKSINFAELEENMSNIDLLQENIQILNSIINKLYLWLILGLVVVFLLYCLLQSLNWNLICNNKLKNYKKYFFKFLLVNVPVWIVSLFVLYKMLFHARGLVVSSWVKETYLENMAQGSTLSLIFYLVVLIVFSYFVVMLYIHLNNNKIIKSIKLSLKEFLDYKLILKYLGLWLVFALLLGILKIHPVLWLVLTLILVQFCRRILSAQN